jgi:16S rRNA processing protein RimM
VLLKLPGVDDMNAALAYRGKVLSIRRDDAGLGPDECFDEELLGMDAYDADTGALLGTVTAVEDYPASKIYTVRGKREYLIPAVPGVFVKSVDLDANRMELHMLEGLATDEN